MGLWSKLTRFPESQEDGTIAPNGDDSADQIYYCCYNTFNVEKSSWFVLV